MWQESDLKDFIIEILKKDGLKLQTAKNIAFGTQPMNNLDRAIRLEKAPYFVSKEVWSFLYKGSNKVEEK